MVPSMPESSDQPDDNEAAAAGQLPVHEPTGLKPVPLPRRFYKAATVVQSAGGWEVLLDSKPARTPGKRLVALPKANLADAVAAEWAAQGERINPSTMPLTRLTVTAIDGVAGRETEVIADMLQYGGSDLLCYRASTPLGHAALQQERWDPILAWGRDTQGLRFMLAEGIVHVIQPESTLQRMAELVGRPDAFSLAALHTITTITGSAILMLALLKRAVTPAAAWAAATADEDWQESQWGVVDEAAARRAQRLADFQAACRLLDLVG
jgi:chaperone required for assembly of F1-ATPase